MKSHTVNITHTREAVLSEGRYLPTGEKNGSYYMQEEPGN